MPRKKRVNPNRVPVRSAAFNRGEIIARASGGNIVYGWLLVLHTLIYHEAIFLSPSAVQEEAVDAAVRLAWKAADDAVVHEMLSPSDLRKAESITGMKTPHPNLMVAPLKTQVDADRLYKRAQKNALHYALCSIALGLERLGYYDDKQLKRVFTNVQITLAEIEEGSVTYDELMADIDKSAEAVGRKNNPANMDTGEQTNGVNIPQA